MTNSDCLAGFNPLHLNKAQRRFFGQKPEPENFRGLLGLFFLPAWHLAWYECEWAAGCISLSDNRRLASAAILDKIRGWLEGWGQEGDPLDTLTAQYITHFILRTTKYTVTV